MSSAGEVIEPTSVRKPGAANSGPFVLPPTQLLAEAAAGTIEIDVESLKENAVRLVEKLEAYGAEVLRVVGPAEPA